MRGDKKFLAYLLFWIGISLCGIEWGEVEKQCGGVTVNYRGSIRCETRTEPPHTIEYNRKIYPNRAAFEKDREVFLRTICDPAFDAWTFGGKNYECL